MNYFKYYNKFTDDLCGKTVFVTGATGILGKNFIIHALNLNADIILSARNEEALKKLANDLSIRFPDSKINYITLDISKKLSIDSAVEFVEKNYPLGIDFLINNAGIFNNKFQLGEDDFEITFQTNFIGTFSLTKKMLPSIEKRRGKVVCVSSISSKWTRCDFEDIDFKTRKSKMKIYSNSKRCLNFSIMCLADTIKRDFPDISFQLVHPGVTATNIIHYKNGGYSKAFYNIAKPFMKLVFMNPKKASLNLLLGMFNKTEKSRWIGPRGFFQVWGKPAARRVYRPSRKLECEINSFNEFMIRNNFFN